MVKNYKKSTLIGYTGFVGSNLLTQHHFQSLYNSKNIEGIAQQEFDLLVCAGVSAVKWLANQAPENDLKNINYLKENLIKTRAKKTVLISTIDVYDHPFQVTEDDIPNINKQDAYGRHRYQLETWVAEHFEDHYILRLPGLFGAQLKKNLIYDILMPLAKSINKTLWQALRPKFSQADLALVLAHYAEDEFGNLQLNAPVVGGIQQRLVDAFTKVGFSTLNFTDSRSSFQFYNLENLWRDINFAIDHDIRVLNLATEPIFVDELVNYVLGKRFENITAKGFVSYDMYTKFAKAGHYLYSKNEILQEIKSFVLKGM